MEVNPRHIAVTVDTVIFRTSRGFPEVLLVRRNNPPFKGKWALPGGFVNTWETLQDAAARELKEETGLEVTHLHQLRAFDDPQRDPRGRTITIAFRGETKEHLEVRGGDDAADARWWRISELPALAFDHAEILDLALKVHPAQN